VEARIMTTRRKVLAWMAAGLAIPVAAQAQTWPQKPVRIIVPFAPGGNTDGIARVIAHRLGETLAQQFVVENRPGANGSLAGETVARAAGDGYTLFMAALPQIAILPALTKAPYDPVKDFAPISNVGTNPFVLTVNPSFPAKTLPEFVDYVRSQPGKLSYGSGGVGSLAHLTMVLFLRAAKLDMTHVPYKGGGPAMADVVAGHLPLTFGNLSEALPHAKNGTVRLIAVTSEKRIKQLPDVPTVAESGYPGFRTVTWNGLMAPAATPKEIVDKLAHEVALAVKDPAVAQRLVDYGVDPLGEGPDAFAATIAEDIRLWAEAVRIAGATLQ
jgi:tripartite-type tricarboxylate transporter receptor subunit TctC